jgi:cysteine desulfurase
LHLVSSGIKGRAGAKRSRERGLYRGEARERNLFGKAMTRRIYLDHAATTPVFPGAKAAMAQALDLWANPNSPHADGRAARAALEDARRRIKTALGWKGELIFTSGASEALEIALGRSKRRVLASAVEHDAVFRAAPAAEILPIGDGAQLCRSALDTALREGAPPIVAVQYVNSETGVVQLVDDLAAQVREAGGLLLSDCAQSAAKVPLPDADLIVLSAHKLGGPPGIGALLVRDLSMIEAVGGQEFGYRAGTQNVPAAVGFASAVEQFEIGTFFGGPLGAAPMARWLSDLDDTFAEIQHSLHMAGALFQPFSGGAGWIWALTMPGVRAAEQLIRFDSAGIAVSAGSACSSGTLKASRVLSALGVAPQEAECTIRVSFGWSTRPEECYRFLEEWENLASDAASRAA